MDNNGNYRQFNQLKRFSNEGTRISQQYLDEITHFITSLEENSQWKQYLDGTDELGDYNHKADALVYMSIAGMNTANQQEPLSPDGSNLDDFIDRSVERCMQNFPIDPALFNQIIHGLIDVLNIDRSVGFLGELKARHRTNKLFTQTIQSLNGGIQREGSPRANAQETSIQEEPRSPSPTSPRSKTPTQGYNVQDRKQQFGSSDDLLGATRGNMSPVNESGIGARPKTTNSSRAQVIRGAFDRFAQRVRHVFQRLNRIRGMVNPGEAVTDLSGKPVQDGFLALSQDGKSTVVVPSVVYAEIVRHSDGTVIVDGEKFTPYSRVKGGMSIRRRDGEAIIPPEISEDPVNSYIHYAELEIPRRMQEGGYASVDDFVRVNSRDDSLSSGNPSTPNSTTYNAQKSSPPDQLYAQIQTVMKNKKSQEHSSSAISQSEKTTGKEDLYANQDEILLKQNTPPVPPKNFEESTKPKPSVRPKPRGAEVGPQKPIRGIPRHDYSTSQATQHSHTQREDRRRSPSPDRRNGIQGR